MVLFSNVKPALCMSVSCVVAPSVGSLQPSVISSIFPGAVLVSLGNKSCFNLEFGCELNGLVSDVLDYRWHKRWA